MFEIGECVACCDCSDCCGCLALSYESLSILLTLYSSLFLATYMHIQLGRGKIFFCNFFSRANASHVDVSQLPSNSLVFPFGFQYWAELGHFRIALGKNILGIEHKVVWATPGSWTVKNFPCDASGKKCQPASQRYLDPSRDKSIIQERLRRRF